MERLTRSGSHLKQRGNVWWYRRAVYPATLRKAFGCREVSFSLKTTSRTEAERREKLHDADFERKLAAFKEDADPEKRRARIVREMIDGTADVDRLLLASPEDQAAVVPVLQAHDEAEDAHEAEIDRLVRSIRKLLPQKPLESDIWQRCRDGILSVVQHHVAALTGTPAPALLVDGVHTLEYAYGRWLRSKSGYRSSETLVMARRHFDAFLEFSKLTMLDQVRRSHMQAWRDKLMDDGKYATNSINQRLQLVGAILRTGWRDAEMGEQNLKGLILPDTDDNDRGAWSRDDILKALTALEPGSWSAWVYLIGLTTSVRLSEPMAAKVGWFNRSLGMIDVNDRKATKGRKLHCMPLLPFMREPLARRIGARGSDEFLFPDAPRSSNPKLPSGHEASKWFGRFFAKNKIDRVYHELRDTWIEAARHSPVDRDIWEIISGHSAATMSDRYGGKKPDVLLAANQDVCKFLIQDVEIMAAMLRLV